MKTSFQDLRYSERSLKTEDKPYEGIYKEKKEYDGGGGGARSLATRRAGGSAT